jgi:hypothetical protein
MRSVGEGEAAQRVHHNQFRTSPDRARGEAVAEFMHQHHDEQCAHADEAVAK